MPILGSLLKRGIKLRNSLEQEHKTPFQLQKKQLLQLLVLARNTEFAKTYHFQSIINNIKKTSKESRTFYDLYENLVPLFDYDKIYSEWWHKARNGERNISWRGKVEYFALSSGTSGSASKYIPITKEMLKSIHKTSIRQILNLSNFTDIPAKIYGKGMLMLGGSTHLNKVGTYFEGDLSGITASQIPFWFQHFYKPGKKIAKNKDWDNKLQEITLKAPKWDIGFIVGVPAWIQILLEKIIDYHKLDNIHEIWPNLKVYTHGGVSFEPYKRSFSKLLGQPLTYIETYLASEGFIGFQKHPQKSIQLVLNNGIFHEFVPFNEDNFDDNNNIKPNAKTLMIDEVEEGKDYAILLSTNAGTWRYLIGDTVKFINKKEVEIIITGRTKHFLSLCGEHLSVDNMNRAVDLVAQELNIGIKEFTVAGISYESLFAHDWYIGTDNEVDEAVLTKKIDEKLMQLNDDYKVERSAALKKIFVKPIKTQYFYKWMQEMGKVGGQNKFPRVLKKAQHEVWKAFLSKYNLLD